MSSPVLDILVRLDDLGEKVPYYQVIQLTQSEQEALKKALERRGLQMVTDASTRTLIAVPNGKGLKP